MPADFNDFNEQKRFLIDALIPLCPFVLIDASRADVEVPEGLKQKDLVLRLGRDKAVMGMPDLTLDGVGFHVTISLRGSLHYVNVPWESVSRAWVGEPFAGPVLIWPDARPVPENEPPKPKGGLRLVKT